MRRTENYKLAEALKGHTRDLILLSATPHQGNHFQFWIRVQLLNPTLFGSPEETVENRHRLNTVMFRRTKADACRPDGDPLFARRWVHTESFLMRDEERRFYERLRDLRSLPLSLRKTNLARLLARRPDGIFVAPFEQGEIGTDLFRAACNMGLEGLVSKRVDRPYRGGRSPDWVKVKNRKHPAMERVKDAFA